MDNHQRNASTASAINILAGIWLIISPFIFPVLGISFDLWNSIIVGVIIAAIAIYRYNVADRGAGWSWLNALFGLWLIVSPFIYRYADTTLRWDTVIIGLVVAVLGIYSASETNNIIRSS